MDYIYCVKIGMFFHDISWWIFRLHFPWHVFKGNNARVGLKVWIWHHVGGQIATRQDLGFAAAYVDGDFTCVDEENGLLDFFQV
jgi:hypothetical protein